MTPPKLLAGKRRGLGLALALVALAQAGFAAAFAEAIGDMAGQAVSSLMAGAIPATAFALAIGVAMLVERGTAERFAQSFVLDCRSSIFAGVIRNRGDGRESRWLTALLGDLTALRNYAVRGSVKLWTSLLAGGAASAWFIYWFPMLGVVVLPFLVGLVVIVATAVLLRREIAGQRNARGRLNRFLIRRVRIEMVAGPCPRGHGLKRLAELSGELRSRIERRALVFGSMELLAAVSGGVAVVVLVAMSGGSQSNAALVGQISLVGFISGRLLEAARALHAQAGGRVALDRLTNLLARGPANGRNGQMSSNSETD